MDGPHVFHSSKLPRVLIVDDEQNIVQFVKIALEKNYCVDTTTSPLEAVKNMPTQPFEIVITDISMNELSGWKLIRMIKEISPSTSVIVITGKPDSEISKKAEAESVFGYLEKPFDAHLINRTVKLAWEDQLNRIHLG